MKYSPKKTDKAASIAYVGALVASLICFSINSSGYFRTVLFSIGLILMATGIYLFVKYSCTCYEYILMERNGTLDFYINKIVGRRGAYVVYYPLTDCVKAGKYTDDMRERLKGELKDLRVSSYVQNFISAKNKYYLVFENKDGYYDAVIFEPSEEMVTAIEGQIERQNEAQA